MANGHFLTWKLISIVVAGALACSILSVVYIIYLNVYVTLSESASISLLSSNLNLDIVDLNAHKQNLEAITKKKKQTVVTANIRNVFVYGPNDHAATTSAKKTD